MPHSHAHSESHAHSDSHAHGTDQLISGAWWYDVRAALLGSRGRRLDQGFADALELSPGDRVLDVGCGPGRLARVLARRVGPTGSVVGVDPSEAMVLRARRKVRGRRSAGPAEFHVAYAQRLPFGDAEFDAVSCTLVLHHVAAEERAEAVRELYRVLKPGGRLIIAEFAGAERPLFQRLRGHRLRGHRLRGQRLRGHRLPFCGGHRPVHDHGPDTLAEARDLAAAAGFVELESGPTPVRWCAQLAGRRPPAERVAVNGSSSGPP